MNPSASIVVLTHNRKDALRECLVAIIDKTSARYELLVVDNGSTDGTRTMLTDLSIQLGSMQGMALSRMRALRRPINEGVCARNVALKEAQGQYILQVDDDVVVGPGWDEALLRPMIDDPRIGAVGQQGFWLNWEGLLRPGATRFLDSRFPQPGDFCDLVMGYCWGWRNDRLPAYIGQAPERLPAEFPSVPRFLYDERFNPHWHEETDIQLQIKAAGYRIRCGPVVSNHRSMKSWQGAHNNDPMIGLHHAIAHEHLLLEKWGERRAELGLELDRRGLQ